MRFHHIAFAMQIQRTNLLRKQFEYIYDQLKAHVPCGSIPDYDKSDYKRLQNTQILSFDLAHFPSHCSYR